MLTVIILLLFLSGWLVGRAISLALAATPSQRLRRSSMLLLTVMCSGPVAVLCYYEHLEPRYVVFSFFLAAAVGFILSQRTDRTVRICVTLLVIPLLITIATTATVVAWDQAFTGSLYIPKPLLTSRMLLGSFPTSLALSLFWYVPIALWKGRGADHSLPSIRRALGFVIASFTLLMVVVAVNDFAIRRRLEQRQNEAISRRNRAFEMDQPLANNSATEYERIAMRLAESDNKDLNAHLDAFLAATKSDAPFRLNEDSLANNFLPTIREYVSGLGHRSISTGSATDLLSVRRLIRQFDQDPRIPPEFFREVEQELRPALESLTELDDIELLFSGITKPLAANNNARATLSQNAFMAQLAYRLNSADKNDGLAARAKKLVRRLFCSDVDMNTEFTERFDEVSVYYGIPFWSDENRSEFYQAARINDAGLLARKHYIENQTLPNEFELRELLDEQSVDNLNITITKYSDGGIVYHDSSILQHVLAEDRSRPLSSFSVGDIYRDVGEDVFVVGESGRIRRTKAGQLKLHGSRIVLIAPTPFETLDLMASIQRDVNSSALTDLKRYAAKEHRANINDQDGLLTRYLDEFLAPGFGFRLHEEWFDTPTAIRQKDDSGQIHRLSFWSDRQIAIRREALANVRRDEFDDAMAAIKADSEFELGDKMEQAVWNDLSLLADFLEWASESDRPIICMTIEESEDDSSPSP